MPIYAFYPMRADGASLTFELLEFASEPDALKHARAVGRDHESCEHVEVWDGDRMVGRVWKRAAATA